MKPLYLEDLDGMTEEEIINHIITEYEAAKEDVNKYDILIASEEREMCEGSSWFLLRDKETGNLYENHGSHCSYYGFEEQWEPEETTLKYLKSANHFYLCGFSKENKMLIMSFINNIKE